jgi:DNA-directed RNA polymerase specialized sigma24 family protein
MTQAKHIQAHEKDNSMQMPDFVCRSCRAGASSGASGDENMTNETAIQIRDKEADLYATHEDFHTIFNNGLNGLYQLSFLLTRNPDKAERCLVSGLDDCVSGNRVFREWAHSWAKRAIIQSAIRELKPRPNQFDSPLSGAIFPDIGEFSNRPSGHFAMDSVLSLEDFERFVFVMSVLEHYSDHDCVLLLGCSAREVRKARARAFNKQMNYSERDVSRNQPFVQKTL